MFFKPSIKLGVGINFRNDIAHDILINQKEIDFIEINAERFFIERIDESLEKIVNTFPVTLHGLTLSVGANYSDISRDYLSRIVKACHQVDCIWFSEHIGMTHTEGIEIRSLMPVEFTEETVHRISKKVKLIYEHCNKPFLLENISYYYPHPINKMSEIDFICSVIKNADCGLLLDLNNLYVNAINHAYDPYAFINKLPLDRIVEVHLAGCHYLHNMWVDTHAVEIKKEVISLFEYLCRHASINGVLIERDAKLECFSDLLDEVKMVRNIFKKNSNL
jgi:uncharacterized protein (UPF0276 family)